MRSRLAALAQTGPIPVWIPWALLAVALATAGLTHPHLIFHGDLPGYANAADGVDWKRIWESLWPAGAYYTDAYGTPIASFDHQIRPWPAVVFLELTGAGSATLGVGLLLYALAGGLLLFTLAKIDAVPRAIGIATLLATALLLASSPVVLFQMLAASEGLTISLCIASLASIVALSTGSSRTGWWIALLVSGSLAGLVRPQLMIVWIPVWVYLIWLHRDRGRAIVAVLLLASALAGCAVTAWTAAYTSSWGGGTSRAAVLALYTTSDAFSPVASDIRTAARDELAAPPACFPVTAERRPDPLPACSDAAARNSWAGDYASWYVRHLIKSPPLAIALARQLVPAATTLTVTAPGVSIVPLPVQQILLGGSNEVVNDGGEPTKFDAGRTTAWLDPIWLGVPVLLALWLAGVAHRWTSRGVQPAPVLTVMVVVTVMSLATIVVTTLTLPSTTLEMNRLTVAPNLTMRIAVIVGIACAVGTLFPTHRDWRKRSLPERPAPTKAAER